MPGDCVRLLNMVFYTYHGAYAAEKELGQRLEVDVELTRDLSQPGTSDDLETAVNYAEVYALVREIVEEREFALLEAIAETVAAELLAAHELEEVAVRVRKPNPPVGGPVDCAEVEIRRRPR
ncbi:MAG: dihydroneopterin aldolase [Patescibacteria group bacterium]